jgi:hypothetical protein
MGLKGDRIGSLEARRRLLGGSGGLADALGGHLGRNRVLGGNRGAGRALRLPLA